MSFDWKAKAAEGAIIDSLTKLKEKPEVGNFHAFVASLDSKPSTESQQLANLISEGVSLATTFLVSNPEAAVVESQLLYNLFVNTSQVGEHCKAWAMLLEAIRDLTAAQTKKPIFQSTSVEDARASVHSYSAAFRSLDERLRTARCSNAVKHKELQAFVALMQEQLPRHRASFSETLHDLIDKLSTDLQSRTDRPPCYPCQACSHHEGQDKGKSSDCCAKQPKKLRGLKGSSQKSVKNTVSLT